MTWQFPRSTPETQGIPSHTIVAFLDHARKLRDLHSFMLVRHGHVIAEGWWQPYAADQVHYLYSISKSFTSTAIGMAIAEGKLQLDDPVISFFPQQAPADPSPELASMTVRHLLTMSTGHLSNSKLTLMEAADGDWVSAFFRHPIECQPGTRFFYTSAATYMLSAIFHAVMGQDILAYLQPRVLDPIGITDATWDRCPRGLSVGGWGLSLSTESIARFGQLYLQNGQWQGQQLVPSDWIAQATSYQIDCSEDREYPDWQQGYGYQFWCSRHNSYRADGAFGQFCLVLPDQDMVIVFTSALVETHPLLDLVWQYLLPQCSDTSLPEDTASQHALQQALSSLAIQPISGSRQGRYDQFTIQAEPNPMGLQQVRLQTTEQGYQLHIQSTAGAETLELGFGQWSYGDLQFQLIEPSSVVVAAGAWLSENEFAADICHYRSAYRNTLRIRFAPEWVLMWWESNVALVEGETLTIYGKLISH